MLRTIQNFLFGAVLPVVALAAAVWIFDAATQSEKYSPYVPDALIPMYPYLPAAYFSLLILAAFFLLSAVFIWTYRKRPRLVARTTRVVDAGDHDFRAIARLGGQSIPSRLSSIELMKRWRGKNSRTIRVCRRVFTFKSGIAISIVRGYYIALPIKKEAYDGLMSQDINGITIPLDWICGNGEEPFAFYIGGICGKGRPARDEILRNLVDLSIFYVEKGAKYALARGATPRGVELLEFYGFYEVFRNDSGPMFQKDLSSLRPKELRRIKNGKRDTW